MDSSPREKREPAENLASNRIVHVLLVEDTVGDAKLISSFLCGFCPPKFSIEIDLVGDGELAVDYLYGRGTYIDSPRPDAVILDINLPKKSGLEVLTEMRQSASLKRIPVFMLTSSRMPEDIVRSYALDAVSFFTKPSQLVEFEDLIKRLLSVEFPRFLRNPMRVGTNSGTSECRMT